MIQRYSFSLIIALLASLFCLSIFSSTTYGQSSFSSSLGNASAATNNPFAQQAIISAAEEEEDEFLQVDQAYQLTISFSDNPNSNAIQSEFSIAPEYYLYHSTFATRLYDENGSSLETESSIPPGVDKFDTIFEEIRELHYDSITLSSQLKNNTTSDARFIQVDYQGCAEAGLCYPPQTRTFSLDPKAQKAILVGGLPSTNTATGISASLSQPNSLDAAFPSNSTISTNDSASLGLLTALILALAGGAILNLMPCVLPVLSIKAISLSKTVDQPHLRHLHGWAYLAGVVSCFLFVAIVLLSLRAAGEAIGWGFQLQSPSVVAALAYLFFFMALSLAGLFHIGSNWMGLGDKYTQSGTGLKSSFATGILAAIVASPCTAPFMGAALGWAITQPTISALSVFIALGVGMALPLTLLCHAPALLNKLPQPGQWMNRFKEFCAYPLIVTAIWLLWILGHQAGSDAVIMALLGAVSIAFAIWLWQSHSKLQKLFAITFVILGLVLGLNQNSVSTVKQTAIDSHWQHYSPEKLSQLRENGKPVFINLTADWCITCLANEKVALSSEVFINTLKENDITYLKGDWTNRNPEITALLSQFERNGVPLYLVYPKGTEGQPEVLPQLLTESSVLQALERAL